jgi:hypothetical protein
MAVCLAPSPVGRVAGGQLDTAVKVFQKAHELARGLLFLLSSHPTGLQYEHHHGKRLQD